MGEIADDMIDGTTCSLCGQFFEDPQDPKKLYTHGYPVVCNDCWLDLSRRERGQYARAMAQTLGGDIGPDKATKAGRGRT